VRQLIAEPNDIAARQQHVATVIAAPAPEERSQLKETDQRQIEERWT
jgi:hypothetical protein